MLKFIYTLFHICGAIPGFSISSSGMLQGMLGEQHVACLQYV